MLLTIWPNFNDLFELSLWIIPTLVCCAVTEFIYWFCYYIVDFIIMLGFNFSLNFNFYCVIFFLSHSTTGHPVLVVCMNDSHNNTIYGCHCCLCTFLNVSSWNRILKISEKRTLPYWCFVYCKMLNHFFIRALLPIEVDMMI